MLYSTIAVLVNSVHNEAGKTWWQPSNLRMVLTPDPATPRKVILSYKGKTLLSLANTTHDNTTLFREACRAVQSHRARTVPLRL